MKTYIVEAKKLEDLSKDIKIRIEMKKKNSLNIFEKIVGFFGLFFRRGK